MSPTSFKWSMFLRSSAGACENENSLSLVANHRSTDARSAGTLLVNSVVENTESSFLAPLDFIQIALFRNRTV